MMPKSMSRPEITAIVPTLNRPEVLARNLEALATSEGIDPGALEVIVVDDGSTGDATRRVLERASEKTPFALISLFQENAGQARARNRAMERARGRIWLFLNDDTIATPGLVAGHLRGHEDHPGEEAGILGRATLARNIPMTPARSLHLDHMWARISGRVELEWYHFWTTNVSVKAAFLERHGLRFDPRIRYIHDDTEMGFRLREHGFRLYYRPEAVGFHDHALSVEDFLCMAEREAVSLSNWAKTHPDAVQELARFGYTPAKKGWEKRLKYPLLCLIFNPLTLPLWLGTSRLGTRIAPALARWLLSQCYAARKRRHIALLHGRSTRLSP